VEILIYRIILFVSIFIVWLSTVMSKFAKYDENYALLGFAVLISIITTALIFGFYYFKKEIVKSSFNLTVSFVSTSSPISLFLFFYSYEDIFGGFFNHPA
jgi:hypothetical protein